MSFPIGPTVSRCSGSIGNTPSMGTNPCVVFNPTTPHQAAGTRIEPAVSVPKATSAIPLATATAEPQLEPPGSSLRELLSGLEGVEILVEAGGRDRKFAQVRFADDLDVALPRDLQAWGILFRTYAV